MLGVQEKILPAQIAKKEKGEKIEKYNRTNNQAKRNEKMCREKMEYIGIYLNNQLMSEPNTSKSEIPIGVNSLEIGVKLGFS